MSDLHLHDALSPTGVLLALNIVQGPRRQRHPLHGRLTYWAVESLPA